MSDAIIRQLMARIEKLEKVVFAREKTKPVKKTRSGFAGPKGGILALMSQGFFKKKKTAPETKNGMAQHDYHYTIQAIQTALNRLSTKDGPLVSFAESGKKVYVQRK